MGTFLLEAKVPGWEQIKDILPIISLAFFAGIIVWATDYCLKESHFRDIFRLLIGGAIGTIVYVIISILFKIKSLQELKKIILRK